MATITDKAMQARPGTSDNWLTHSLKRGAGSLAGRITPSGERLFYFRYTDSTGARRLLPLGPYHPKGASGLTLAQAFDKANEWSALYRSGVKDLREHLAQQEADARQANADARAEAEAQRKAAALEATRHLTVRQLFDRWCATELQPQTRADGKRTGRKDGGAYVRAQFERHIFPVIGDVPATALRKGDMLAVIDEQKAKGQLRTASVLLSDLRQMMAFALDRELVKDDPLASIKKARIVGVAMERNRVLTTDEIQALATALPTARMNARSEAAVWVLLATGARVGELMGAIWSDALPSEPLKARAKLDELRALAEKNGAKVGVVNMTNRTWHLPDTKNQRSHTIHLSAFALSHFHRLGQWREVLPDTGELSPWVFPARDPKHPVCVKSFGKQLSDRQRPPERRMSGRSRRTHALSLPGGRWTAHDLRRTAGTLMARLGISGDVIDEALNHMIESRVRRTYIRDRREAEQARAFDALGEKLSAIISGGATTPGNVVSLRGTAAR